MVPSDFFRTSLLPTRDQPPVNWPTFPGPASPKARLVFCFVGPSRGPLPSFFLLRSTPHPRTTLSQTLLFTHPRSPATFRRTAHYFGLFTFSRPKYRSVFPLLGVFSLNFGCVFECTCPNCTFGLSKPFIETLTATRPAAHQKSTRKHPESGKTGANSWAPTRDRSTPDRLHFFSGTADSPDHPIPRTALSWDMRYRLLHRLSKYAKLANLGRIRLKALFVQNAQQI